MYFLPSPPALKTAGRATEPVATWPTLLDWCWMNVALAGDTLSSRRVASSSPSKPRRSLPFCCMERTKRYWLCDKVQPVLDVNEQVGKSFKDFIDELKRHNYTWTERQDLILCRTNYSSTRWRGRRGHAWWCHLEYWHQILGQPNPQEDHGEEQDFMLDDALWNTDIIRFWDKRQRGGTGHQTWNFDIISLGVIYYLILQYHQRHKTPNSNFPAPNQQHKL